MKRTTTAIAIIFAALFLSFSAQSQDVIHFKDGTKISVKILQVMPDKVIYEANKEGATISVLIGDINTITYASGHTDTLTVPPKTEVKKVTAAPEPKKPTILEMNDGKRLSVVIIDITTELIRYRRADIPNSPIYGVIPSSVKLIEYPDEAPTPKPTTKQQPEQQPVKQQPIEQPTANQEPVRYAEPSPKIAANNDAYMKGVADANRFYEGYHGAATGTLITTLLTTPLIGLIPAVSCSSAQPSQNLGMPSYELSKDPDYYHGYLTTAHKKKSRKVWSNYGIGAGIYTVFLAIVVSSLK